MTFLTEAADRGFFHGRSSSAPSASHNSTVPQRPRHWDDLSVDVASGYDMRVVDGIGNTISPPPTRTGARARAPQFKPTQTSSEPKLVPVCSTVCSTLWKEINRINHLREASLPAQVSDRGSRQIMLSTPRPHPFFLKKETGISHLKSLGDFRGI